MTYNNITLQGNKIGVRIETSIYWTSYTGTKDDLLNEGVCTIEQFPEGKKRKKYSFVNQECVDDWCVSKIKGGLFELMIHHKERRELPQKRDCQYHSAIAWKFWVGGSVSSILEAIEDRLTGDEEKSSFGEATIKLDKESLDIIRDAIKEINSTLIYCNPVWAGNAGEINSQLKESKKDKKFQEFLCKLTQ